MADSEDNGSMDLNLNLSPPSSPHLGLALGLGTVASASANDDELLMERGSFRGRLWARGFELNILSERVLPQSQAADPHHPRVENVGALVDDETFQEIFPQGENRRYRSNPLRHRWRRNRRNRPSVLDASPISVRSDGLSPFIIVRAVDHTGGGGNGNSGDNELERITPSPETLKENLCSLPAGTDLAKEDVDEGSSNNNAANFECNICLDMASDPVVTSCGHLFCWACLYQWLHVHSSSKECPVCKGEVTDMNITPIYGRGNSDTADIESKMGESGVKIPPRPRAHRIESLRQRFGRPISRRVVEAIRLSRRQEGQNDNRADADAEGERDRQQSNRAEGVDNLLGAAADQILNRLRLVELQRHTATLQRDLQRTGSGDERWQVRQILARRALLRANNGSSPSYLDVDDPVRLRRREAEREGIWGFGRLHRSERASSERVSAIRERASSERLAAIRERVASMEGMIDSFTRQTRNSNNTNANGNPFPSFEQGIQGTTRVPVSEERERASVSSTNAVIQNGSRNGDAVLEQDSGRSTSPQRRRPVPSASLDADGGLLHVRKRRRLN